MKSWNKTSAEGSSWKERAEAAEAALLETAEANQELEERLQQIAEIAAPDQSETLERIEHKLDYLLKHLPGIEPPPEST